ncbi:thiaminase II [Paenibacillus aurantius]|uniref:Aminopyrimidine aminohydrolase n=1 Tax=Paenibacillus aurantius TaxID=2918900 RepID=A0AA96LFC3_9BACL|nr:thiaminase II [Paenibacillus aurantius]WNQ12847.1 thiaminase II [Paenibacillus aurantius]
MENFTDRLYAAARPIWQESHHHAFLYELREGTLAPDRFAFYLCQDYVYLLDYAKLFALGIVKAEEEADMAWFAELVHSTLHGEMDAHRRLASSFGITRAKLENTKPSAVTLGYTGYMLGVAEKGSLADLVAVLLPCMWSYREVGVLFKDYPGALDHPLYGEWILTYASEEFGKITDWLIDRMNRLAQGLPEPALRRLEELFVTASRYEYRFWDMAYKKEMW